MADPNEPDKVWDEYDWERFLQQQDRKTEKYMELLERYIDDPNRDQIIAREMGWYHLLDKDGEKWAESVDSLFEEENGEADATEDEVTAEADEAKDDAEGFEVHPLYKASFALTVWIDQLFEEMHDIQNQPAAGRLSTNAAIASAKLAAALSDDDVSELIGDLAREHLIAPDWGPSLGGWLEKVTETGAHHGAVDLAAENIVNWLNDNPQAFDGVVSRRLPSWVPSMVVRLIDDTLYREAVSFVSAVRADQDHPARHAIDAYLARLADNLQHDPATIGRLEDAKVSVFDSPRVRGLASEAWETAKTGLLSALADPQSGLRVRAADALVDIGERLETDAALQARVDGWVIDAAVFVVERYRHDIASIITDTIERWDPEETTEKIELMVGRDLQYIRLNGTIVGALAGLAIFTIAHAVFGA